MLDGAEFGKEIVDLVRGYVERELGPIKAENESLKARVAALEALPGPEKGEPGEKGADGITPAPEAIAGAFAPLAEQIIAEAVGKAVAELPAAEKGEQGDPGKDVEPEALQAAVDAAIAKAVEALPAPKDGEPGKDAANIVEALKDSGELVLTLQDGRLIRTGIRDGEDGKNGRDGFSIDDFDCRVLEDDRTIELSFKSGENEHIAQLKWPTAIYRGVYKEDTEYERGDEVTWGGSQWHCDQPTKDKPGTENWTLAVKKGRDGKDAKGG